MNYTTHMELHILQLQLHEYTSECVKLLRYAGPPADTREPEVPAFNQDVFSAAGVASRQFSTLNSFNSLYNLPPG